MNAKAFIRQTLTAGAVALSAAASVAFSSAQAGDAQFVVAGAYVKPPISSMAARKFETVVQQRFDFSCGSAAIATLLTHHYGRETTEVDAFKAMWDVGDQDRIRELGFSLFEMKSYTETLGLVADGFKLTLDRIESIGVPGIALIDVNGYKHFVVIKGMSDDLVLIGDPSRGILTMARDDFEEIWDGVILFIRSDVQAGKRGFNQYDDWALVPAGPDENEREHENLQSFLLHQTRPAASGMSIGTLVTPLGGF